MTSFFFTQISLLLFLFFIEIIFSGDNFLAISSLAARLTPQDRSKALWIGFISGLILRCLAIISFTFLIEYPSIQLVGSLYLIFIGGRELFFPRKHPSHKPHSFWKTVCTIEITDVLFAIDSILAAFAIIASQPNPSSKIWMVYFSSLLGMLVMRLAASKMAKILSKFPRMILASHLLIIWIGLKFCIEVLPHYLPFPPFPQIAEYYSFIFWIGSAIVILYGLKSKPKLI